MAYHLSTPEVERAQLCQPSEVLDVGDGTGACNATDNFPLPLHPCQHGRLLSNRAAATIIQRADHRAGDSSSTAAHIAPT